MLSVPEGGFRESNVCKSKPEPGGDENAPMLTDSLVTSVALASPSRRTQEHNLLFQLQEENQRLREELKKRDKVHKKMITHSMGVALEQTLMDFSPNYLEKLFDDYSAPTPGWFRRRDNWQMYTRHFARVIKEQSARLAFTARFQAAMRKLQEETS